MFPKVTFNTDHHQPHPQHFASGAFSVATPTRPEFLAFPSSAPGGRAFALAAVVWGLHPAAALFALAAVVWVGFA